MFWKAVRFREIIYQKTYILMNNQTNYYSQLNGIRAIAIFGVFLAHFITPTIGMTLPYGSMGVRLFFVLSGFLITSILLKARELVQSKEQTFLFTLRQFYIRRALRIFCVYYAWIFVTNFILVGGKYLSFYICPIFGISLYWMDMAINIGVWPLKNSFISFGQFLFYCYPIDNWKLFCGPSY
jgi:peptidoglycan/LPS O-acetylase OafA/YrhL